MLVEHGVDTVFGYSGGHAFCSLVALASDDQFFVRAFWIQVPFCH